MDKKVTLKSGERLTISINRKKSGSESSTPKPTGAAKGIISSRRPADYLKRRVKSGFVNFYDVMQMKNESGIWRDRQFFASHGGDYTFSGADWASVREFVYAVPESQWKGKYRKLDYETADDFGLSVYFGQPLTDRYSDRLHKDNPLWTEKGFKMNGDPFGFSCAGVLTTNFVTPDLAKVTSVLDYEADAVEMPHFTSADIFLMPAIVWRFARCTNSSQHGVLVGNATFVSRELFRPIKDANFTGCEYVDYPLMYFTIANPFISQHTSEVNLPFPDVPTGAKISNGFIARLNSDIARSPDASYKIDGAAHPISEFPIKPFSTGTYSYAGDYLTAFESEVLIPNGVLTSIIKTGGKTCYCWSKNYAEDDRVSWFFEVAYNL